MGIVLKILGAFSLFGFGLAMATGLAGYMAASHLSLDFLAQRSDLLLNALIQAEKLTLSGKDTELDGAELIEALNLDFLVGKQVSVENARLDDGIHIVNEGRDYIYLKHEDGIPYAIYGTLASRDDLISNICLMLAICGLISVLFAIPLAIFLSIKLAGPIRQLAAIMQSANTASSLPIPQNLTLRKDEIGLLANTLCGYQQAIQDFIERERSFTSSASHELRTPLTIITQGLELVESRVATDSTLMPLIIRLQSAADHMRCTLDELLAMARGEKRDLEQLDIRGIILEAAQSLVPESSVVPRIEGKGESVRLQLNDNCALIIEGNMPVFPGNRQLAYALFRNLVENALRHCNNNDIIARLAETSIEIRNKAQFIPENSGGLGLMITARACEHMNWNMTQYGNRNETIFKIVPSRE